MSAENAKDSFYQLFVSATGEPGSFKKVELLQNCAPPSDAKVLDVITPTDGRRELKAPVDFKEESEIELEYVLLPEDVTHKLLQTSFDKASELHFQLKIVEAPSESRQFKGIISELTLDSSDIKKKLRKKGKITLTSDTTTELTA